MSDKKTLAFTVRLPTRRVEIVDELIEAEVYSSRGECIRDVVRPALVRTINLSSLFQDDMRSC